MATHQPHCCSGPVSGYFGKPTKSRSQEPSMYEILTWNATIQRSHQQREYQACENCHKCSHSNSDHIEEGGQIHKAQNYQRKDIQKANDPQISKNRRQSQRMQNGNSPISKKSLQYQSSQKNLTTNKSPFQEKTGISDKKQRPQSAQRYQQKVSNNYNKTNTPNYMKDVKNNSRETSEEKENRMFDEKEKKIQKFVQTTRWIPNSAFTTYFGKPAFENYGRANTNPTSGGLLYGNYLKSHNVQPHRGQNSPDHIQSYSVALMKAKQIGQICPYPPKMNKKDMEVAEKQFEQNNPVERSPICAQKSELKSFPIRAPPLAQLERFGGKGIQKVSRTRFSAPNNNTPNYCEW